MKTKDILTVAKSMGLQQAEIFKTASSSSGFEIFEGKLDSYQNAQRQGISLRGIKDGKLGYAYTEMDDDASIERCLQQCIENASLLGKKEEVEFVSPQPIQAVQTYFDSLDQISFEEKRETLLRLEKLIRSKDERITQVQCRFHQSTNETIIANTQGLDCARKSNAAVIVTTCVALENQKSVVVYDIQILFDFHEFDVEACAGKIVDKVLRKLNPVKIPSGNYRCIIENETFADLLEALSGMFSQENVLNGISVLKQKKGQSIFSDKITLIDDPLMERGYNSCSFDDEGNACYQKTVVENGVLKLLLNDQKSAKEAHESCTGNGFRGSYAGGVVISPTNFYVKAGDVSLENMIETMGTCIMITEVKGIHAGINSLTTDFSLEAGGFYIEGGKNVKAISSVTIAANFMELMNQVEAVGNDLVFGSDGVGSPSIAFREIALSGE